MTCIRCVCAFFAGRLFVKTTPKQLCKAIDVGVATFGIDAAKLMVKLENWLWRNSTWKDEGEEDPPRGLIAVVAGNGQGVPPPGAIKCLAALLRRFPTDYCTQPTNMPWLCAEQNERAESGHLHSFAPGKVSRCRRFFPSRTNSRLG